MSEVRLTEAPKGKDLEILYIKAGTEARRRLNSMGFHIGDVVLKLSNGKWGPVIVQNISSHTTKTALGRGLAEKIIVGLRE